MDAEKFEILCDILSSLGDDDPTIPTESLRELRDKIESRMFWEYIEGKRFLSGLPE